MSTATREFHTSELEPRVKADPNEQTRCKS